MALTADRIASLPGAHETLRQQSAVLLSAYSASPRLSSVFATQQRWLLAHIAFALFFRGQLGVEGASLSTARFLDVVEAHKVASRNTADAFLKQMLTYGYIEPMEQGEDKRLRPMRPSTASIDGLDNWAKIHLSTLDSLDGGNRLPTYVGTPDALARLEPPICDGLLLSPAIREPEKTFSLFTWLNNGGVVMDWLLVGIEDAEARDGKIQTGVMSIGDMADWLKLSRTHLARKLREAEAMGSIGWEGQRGHSRMWVSPGFRDEYMAAQSAKLAAIDAAFDVALAR